MAYPASWSIKGVDEDAKAIAKREAMKRGVTMGAWLEAAVFSAAASGLKKNNSAMTASSLPAVIGGDDSAQKLFNTTIRLGGAPASSALLAEFGQMQQRWQDHFISLQARFDDMEARLAAKLDALAARPAIEYKPLPQRVGSTGENLSVRFEVTQSSAPSPMAREELFSARNMLRVALIVTVALATFMIGQKVGLMMGVE